MSEYHDLVQALTWLITHKLQARGEYTRGLLGDGQGHIQVPGREDFTYVRPDRYTTRVFEVFNKQVSGPDGLPVILGELPWQPGLTQVLDVDWETYYGVGWGNTTPGGRLHGPTHEWRDGAPGVDTFNVYTRQMAPLRTYPVGSGSTSVYVSAYNLNHLGDIKSWPGLAGTNLTAAIPSATGTARFVLTYWDPASGTSGYVGVATGTLGLDAGTETLDRPAPPAGTIPSAWVRLAGGQSSITEFDIWDARMPWMPSLEFGTGSGAIHAGLIPISDVGGYYTGSTVEAALEEAATSGGGPPSGAAGGDLTGSYPNPQVAGLRGSIVDGEAPTEGYLLTYTGSAWRPRPAPVFPGSALPTGPAGGDLTGSYPDPLVAGLFGYSLLNSAPSEGDVLMFTGSAWQPLPGTSGIDPATHIHSKLVASDGAPDPAWSVDASGHLIPENSLILKGKSSNFNDLGTTTLAEKLGHIYLGTAKDIYPSDDDHGLWQRNTNYGQTPAEHWTGGADALTWTGFAAYTGFITPNTITKAGSQMLTRDTASTGRWFYYRSYINAQTTLQCMCIGGRESEAGLMVDDGVNAGDGLGANNFCRWFIEWPTVGTNPNLAFEYRTGGGAVTKTTYLSLPPTDMYALRMIYGVGTRWTNWSSYIYVGVKNVYDSSSAFNIIAIPASGLTWTPARHGLYARLTVANRAIIWDWFDE